ncbi:MAG: hypothetical protein LBJ00_08605 [Planctomycetaceae bacterium]|nr:hypothetical protein [Planctomycetaceae bacterium]
MIAIYDNPFYTSCLMVIGSLATEFGLIATDLCSRAKPTAHTGFGILLVLQIRFGRVYTKAVLELLKLDTQAYRREAIIQGQSLPPVPASVFCV